MTEKLFHQIDKRFEIFGKDYIKILNKRLEKFRSDNELSDKTDEQVFDYLKQNCLHFEEEEKPQNVSIVRQINFYFKILIICLQLSSTNWTLDYANYNYEKIAFNRMSFKRQSENSFAVTFRLNIWLTSQLVFIQISFTVKAVNIWPILTTITTQKSTFSGLILRAGVPVKYTSSQIMTTE